MSEQLVEVRNLVKEFPVRGGLFRSSGVVSAVADVTIGAAAGETLASWGSRDRANRRSGAWC